MKDWHKIAILVATLLLGFGIGYLIFHTKVPNDIIVNHEIERLKKDSIIFQKQLDRLLKKDSILVINNETLNSRYDSISKKHRKDRADDRYDGTREQRILSIHNDLSRLY